MIKVILVRCLDAFWREPKAIWRDYRPFSKKEAVHNRYVFMVDGKRGHGGMFDRLKGLISIYAIAKSQQKEFKIHFIYPFKLEKYLQPRDYNWSLGNEGPNRHYPAARPVIAYGECYHPTRLFKDRKRETHFYYGYDSLKEINERFGTNYQWGKLYHELFIPTSYLQQYIDKYKKEIGDHYIVIHTRFLNLLGDKTETAINPELPDDGKKMLMDRIRNKIDELVKEQKETATRVMLASDSMTFISYMKEVMPSVYVVPGTVKHIDTAGKTDDSENIKMFLDYYLISMADKVYNIVAEGMWPSAFPEYAAKIGSAPFERLEISSK